MATSSFGKIFRVSSGKSIEFVEEMTKTEAPTLRKDFKTGLTHLSQDSNTKKKLLAALGKAK